MSITAVTEIQTPRPRMPWPTYCGIGLACLILYFASIGPLAWLESRHYCHKTFWQTLKVAYVPVYASWRYGPADWGKAIKCYLELFRPHPRASGLYEFATPNQVEWDLLLEEMSSIPYDDYNPLSFPTFAK